MGDSQQQRRKWDARHSSAEMARSPCLVLEQNAHLLPAKGRALDLACGLGRNALFLARHGLDVDAWDFSPVAVKRLDAFAREQGLAVRAEVRNVDTAPPPAGCYDVLVVSFFLQRALASHLCAALRSGGLLFYQTFTREQVDGSGPGNPDFRLGPNELLDLFKPLRVLVYREEGRVGDTEQGLRNEALLVATKPEM